MRPTLSMLQWWRLEKQNPKFPGTYLIAREEAPRGWSLATWDGKQWADSRGDRYGPYRISPPTWWAEVTVPDFR